MSGNISNTVLIGIEEARARVEALPEAASVEDRLKAAFDVTANHWLLRTDDERFRAGVGGVMLFYGERSEEFKILEAEMLRLQKASALINAAMAGISVEVEDDFKPSEISLLVLFHASKNKRNT